MSVEEEGEVLLGHKESLETSLRVDDTFSASVGVNLWDCFV